MLFLINYIVSFMIIEIIKPILPNKIADYIIEAIILTIDSFK